MSSSPTGRTSTTCSSTSLPSPAEARSRIGLVACGALASPCSLLIERHDWPVDVHPLPPLLHNSPHRIAVEVEALALRLLDRYREVAIGYADCGTYGALDEVCRRLGLRRLSGLHCYDVYAGPERLRMLLEAEPGTYVLTDFLVRSFERTVRAELGLDRYPELRDSYFGNYRRLVWLAQEPHDPQLRVAAQNIADTLELPLTVIDVGYAGLDRSLR